MALNRGRDVMKNDVKQLNRFQEIAEHKKLTIRKNQQDRSKQVSWEQNQVSKEFDIFEPDHLDNTLQRILKSFQTKPCLSLRNSEIYKQKTIRQFYWLTQLKVKIHRVYCGGGGRAASEVSLSEKEILVNPHTRSCSHA